MAELRITDDELRVELTGRERVGALARSLAFPIGSIESVERVEPARAAIRGMRAPGTGLPGVIALGTWRRRGVRDFVAAYGDDAGYVITLAGERFDRLIVSSGRVAELDALLT